MSRTVRMIVVTGLGLAMFGVGAGGLLVRPHVPATATPAAAGGKPAQGEPVPAAPPPLVGFTSAATRIAGLQARLRSAPDDPRASALLGLAYVQQARITADPSYYVKADGLLERSLALQPGGNDQALLGMAALSAARHDFSGARAWAERSLALDPHHADTYAILGDAQLELGRYRDAFATFQRAVDLKPELATYARASYALELQGDVPGAIRAMHLALDAAGSAADAAWAQHQLGELSYNRGDLDGAERWFARAARQDPSFVPPEAGLAKVAGARGDLDGAIRRYEDVVGRFPLPEYVIALGDLYRARGRATRAAQQFALVGVEERLFRANGVNVDLEIALFDADHGVDLAGGLAAARDEWARRHSIHVADALAWSLYANGRFAEALGYADRALALGTRSALFHFHRGMIERALGDVGSARSDLATALDINTHFSTLWSARARAELDSLGGRP